MVPWSQFTDWKWIFFVCPFEVQAEFQHVNIRPHKCIKYLDLFQEFNKIVPRFFDNLAHKLSCILLLWVLDFNPISRNYFSFISIYSISYTCVFLELLNFGSINADEGLIIGFRSACPLGQCICLIRWCIQLARSNLGSSLDAVNVLAYDKTLGEKYFESTYFLIMKIINLPLMIYSLS